MDTNTDLSKFQRRYLLGLLEIQRELGSTKVENIERQITPLIA